MSVYEIMFSLNYVFQPFLLPKATSKRVYAIGTDASCNALGFWSQFSLSALLYNGLLSHYFLLTIRFGWKEDAFAKWIEPLMHMFAIGFPMVTAIAGSVLGVYHEVGLGMACWVDNYPKGCDLPGSSVKCKSSMVAWVFGGSILIFVVVSLSINNLIIYFHVRSTMAKSQRRSWTRVVERSGELASSAVNHAPAVDSKVKRVRAVATQAFLYVAAFVLSYVWTGVLRNLESAGYTREDEATLFPLLVLQALFEPIQGWFNLLVYVRPRYMQARTKFGAETRWWCFRKALFENHVHPESSSRTRPGSSKVSRDEKLRTSADEHNNDDRQARDVGSIDGRD